MGTESDVFILSTRTAALAEPILAMNTSQRPWHFPLLAEFCTGLPMFADITS
ncbi:hypothetical protein [Oceanisphaera ostreae]|uniref:Uncharacterized protein n=1 Tax=Oceanisphaera ostreae TaxID=914151 RepID=A0ABW3KJR1_9GAMM